MKTKLYPILIVLSMLIFGLVACNNDNPTPTDNPYAPEGKMFLPVLSHKPDMEKIELIEKGRTGRLEKKLPADPDNDRDYILYEYSYKGMKVKSIQYLIHPTKGTLLEAIAVIRKDGSTLKDYEELLKKRGFNDSHILAKRYSSLAKEDDTLFAVIRSDEEVEEFTFRQFGRQTEAQATFAKFNDEWDTAIENPLFTYLKIKEVEDSKGSKLIKTELMEYGEHKGHVKIAIFGMAEAERPMLYRVYLFNVEPGTPANMLGTCKEMLFCYDDPKLGFYEDDIQDEDIPTREFLDLYKKAGYTDILYREHYSFKNQDKKLVHGVKTMTFDEFREEPLLVIKLHKEGLL